jgi:magnesium chelatase family protein
MLIAATNPCPCGFAGVDGRCACGEADLKRHQRKLSGPLLDRLDLLVDVRRLAAHELNGPPSITSAEARAVVIEARERQRSRFAGTGTSSNGEMDVRLVRRHARLDANADATLNDAYQSGVLSARGRHRVLRVARTIADLEHHKRVTRLDVLTALGMRQRSGAATELAA